MNNAIEYWDKEIVHRHVGVELNWLYQFLDERQIKKISFIDIGGNVGKFYDELSNKYEIDHCVIVEPSKKLYDYMVQKYRDKKNVTLFNFGISENNGLYHFDDSGIDYWNSRDLNDSINLGVFKMNNSEGNVQFYNVDFFVRNYSTIKPKDITFIKIDTENRDLHILKDLKKYLRENKINPFILFENNFHNDMSFEEAKKIIDEFCETCGYEKVDLTRPGDSFIKPIEYTNDKKKYNMKSIYKLLYDFKIDKKYWDKTSLSGEDYSLRSKPAPYLRTAIEIAKILGLKTVVEIGATRFAVTQKCLDYFDKKFEAYDSPSCCTDGHCGFFFGEYGFDVHAVDINEHCISQIKWSYQNLNKELPNNVFIEIPKDGIDFLKNFNKKIDVLLLDGWDVGTPNYALRHLEAFEAAKDKLSDIHLILIDDTDFRTEDGGKDALLSPHLIELGYIPLFNGRQTLFINTLDFELKNEIKVPSPVSMEYVEIELLPYEYDNSNYNTEFPNPKKVILSMTTVPSRLNEIREGWGMKPVLDILLNLSYTNYEIHLNIPYVSKNNNEEYVIPNWLIDLSNSNTKLKIFRCNDYGSITKIVPTLIRVTDPEQIIITVDDDLLYMDGFIQYFLKKEIEYVDSALGFAGIGSYDGSCHLCATVKKDTKIKIIEGYKTAFYKRKFFTEDFFSDFVGQSWNDDLLISAHLSKNNIDKYVLNYNRDTDFRSRVESFPCIRTVSNERSGCSWFRDKNINDNNQEIHQKYIK